MKKSLLAFAVVLAFSAMAVASDIAFYVGTPNPGWYDAAPMLEHVETIIARTGHLFKDVQKFDDSQLAEFAAWIEKNTNDGEMDIIWLNGTMPSCLYQFPNVNPDGSRAEAWLDGGNMIINVGDWFAYCSYEGGSRQADNGGDGAANILDLSSGIIASADGTQLKVTPTGSQYLPSLNSPAKSDRPVVLSAVQAPWEVAAIFASSGGTDNAGAEAQADPVVIHNKATGGYVAFINQASGSAAGWITDRGLTCAEFIGNWVATVVGLGDRSLAGVLTPKDRAVDVPRDVILGWTKGEFAQTHDVYLGTSFDDVNNASRIDPKGVLVSPGQDATTYSPAGLLAFGQTYYWRVDEVNAPPDSSIHKGKAWSFTSETYGYPVKPVKATASGSMASTMGPDKTIDRSGLDAMDQHGVSASHMWLSKKNQSPIWIQYEFDKVYKLYQMWVWNSNQAVEPDIGFGAKDVVIETSLDGTTWTPLAEEEFAQATGEPNYVHNTTVDFAGVQAKYVKLNIKSNWADGTKQAGLSEVRFFYVPLKAFGPTPTPGSMGVALDTLLNWRPGREAVKHQVYLGSDPSALALVNTATSHSLGLGSLGLLYGQPYYWKVTEVNDAAGPAQEGDVWGFTTIGYQVVDDFEAYDDVCNRIFFGWEDGFGNSGSPDCSVAGSPGNGTGSTVGNLNPPFAERTVVHSGSKSMPMGYDNTRGPFYSEAQREWSAAQAWTTGGVNTLELYVRGDAPPFLETSPGTILMNGTGTDVWNNADQFRFVYKQLSGNGSIVARVDSVTLANEWSKAGVMIRETLAVGSAHAFVAATPTPTHGISYQRRLVTDDVSTSTDVNVAPITLPYWVKVTRTANAFAAQYSTNGTTWVDITVTPALTFTMANSVYIGLAVTSHDAALVSGAKFSNVSTTGGVSGSWQVAEIGVAQVGGNAPETFYVALQDNAGKLKAISSPDPTVISMGVWQQWTIPLSQFTSAGVNLGSIKRMMVGVGDRNSPKVGGAGKVYIDDIRLTRIGP